MSDLTWTNETRKLGDLVPWPRNPRQIDKAEGKRLAESLDEFAQVETIAVGPGDEVYNGHQRLNVWMQEHGPELQVDVRVSNRPLTEKEREKLTVYLHRGAAGGWDWDALASWGNEIELVEWGFSEEELGIDLSPEPPEDPGAQVDRAAELQEQWGTERGQIWEIPSLSVEGRCHRVMCGDSTSAEDVGRLMGGEKAHLMVLDPPYGIERDKGFEGFGGFGGFGPPIARRQYDDEWDSERLSKDALLAMIGRATLSIIFGGNFYTDLLPQGNHWLVWDKENTMPTFGDCELAWTNAPRNSVKKYTVVYNGLIGKEKDRFHPTQKPAALLKAIIEDYSKLGVKVVDFVCGSGTTLVACEQTGRIGYGMEIEPKYVAVTLQRLADMGMEPRLATD